MAKIDRTCLAMVVEQIPNPTKDLENIKHALMGLNQQKGESTYIADFEHKFKYTSLVCIYTPFVQMIDTYLRGEGEDKLADTLLAHKDEFIDFLKRQKWTNKDMNQSWFTNKDGVQCYGLATADNYLTANSHCVCLYSDCFRIGVMCCI